MNVYETVWIIGAKGRIGRSLAKILDPSDYRLLSTDMNEVDITNLQETLTFAERNMPMAIINCAALSSATACEENPKEAFKVNAIGARNVAIAANACGAKLVHLSTDDVFSGDRKVPLNEFHPTDATTVYGITKSYGERLIRDMCSQHFIIRSSWIYDERTLRKIRLGLKAGNLRYAPKQIASPTSAPMLASFIADLLETYEFGTYHYTASGLATREEFIAEAARLMGLEKEFSQAKIDVVTETIHPDVVQLESLMLSAIDYARPSSWRVELERFVKDFMKKERSRHDS